MIELLAPAGNRASFDAALRHGADAVYLGAAAFGARATAGFDEQALADVVRLAHLYGKRVYITVNTLIKQQELAQVKALLCQLDNLRMDAVIVQDLGLIRYIKAELPELAIHASTQMSVHNAIGAQLLMDCGVSRVVLARECSLESIAAVAATGIETEVFVHGAQCVSVSGQCLLSSQIGGRSGNRGRCAQACRLPYLYRDSWGAWLSPRDLCLLERVPDLIAAGVGSFKIEGRLKRPEYVAIATAAYRRAIDSALQGKPNESLMEDRKALMQVFNRGGFTSGYAGGQADAQLIYPQHVSHEGLPLGQLQHSAKGGASHRATLLVNTPLHHGDMLQIKSETVQDFIYSGPTVEAGHSVTVRHHLPARGGDKVARLVDEHQLKQARERSAAPMPGIPLQATLSLALGQPSSLRLSDGQVRVQYLGDVPQPAQAQPLTLASSQKSIQKTGGSPFLIEQFVFEAADDVFLPVASLNALRRQALLMMEQARIDAHPRPASIAQSLPLRQQKQPLREGLYVHTEGADSVDMLRQAGADAILFSPQDYTDPELEGKLCQLRPQDYVCLPKQLRDSSLRMLHELATRCQLPVVIDNVAQLALQWPRGLIAGSGIPAWNRATLDFLAHSGVDGFVLSHELSRDEADELQINDLPMLLPVYGRAEVMLLNHCPERSYRGLSGSQQACRLCQAGEGSLGRGLTDRLGAFFPLAPQRLPEGCLNRLLFHRPRHLSRKAFGRRWLLQFTDEPVEQMLSITGYYAALLRGDSQLPDLPIPYDSGRLDAGVQ